MARPYSGNGQDIPSDTDLYKYNTLYNREDPSFAFNNVMSDLGYNPYRAANPYMDYLRRLAPGLTDAYRFTEVQRHPSNDAPGAAADAAKNASRSYGNFLYDAINGGGAHNALMQAQQQLPQMIAGVRHYGEGPAGGAQNTNPWLAEVNDRFGANNGQGLVQTLQGMYAPFMTPRMSGAYSQALGNQYQNAMRQFAESENPLQTDVYRYFLGY